jgi:RNA polymerase sigma-70 factor (ECF subfamily)
MTWLQPYPDALLEEAPTDQPGPEAIAIGKETLALAFLATIQLLPPRQRAATILREVLEWSAADIADLLDTSVASVNSALQRARATLQQHGQDGRLAWRPAREPDAAQRRLLARYIQAHEQADPEMLVALLREDVRLAIPNVGEWNGRDEVATVLRQDMTTPGRWHAVAIAANGQPGMAGYVLEPDR